MESGGINKGYYHFLRGYLFIITNRKGHVLWVRIFFELKENYSLVLVTICCRVIKVRCIMGGEPRKQEPYNYK